MSGIVWLASYPKSGNTWVRAFLAAYRSAGGETVDLNHLGSRNAAQRLLFDQLDVIEPTELSDEEIQRLRPDLYRAIAASSSSTVYLKVHDAWRRTEGGEAIFPAEVTQAVVYIVRHPAAVAASLAAHNGISIEAAIDTLANDDWTLGGSATQLTQRPGSWTSHVTSWLDDCPSPRCVIRYEDVLRDAVTAFTEVLLAAGEPVEPERVERSAAAVTFDRLRTLEQREGFIERQRVSSAPFFREGAGDGWRAHISERHFVRLTTAHGPAMRRFGYL